jgi:site-specific recombinase XerD
MDMELSRRVTRAGFFVECARPVGRSESVANSTTIKTLGGGSQFAYLAAMLRKLLEAFLRDLAETQGRSPKTVDAYRRDLVRWVEYLETQYAKLPGTAPNDPLLLRVFLRERSQAGVSNRSLARYLSAGRFQRSCRRSAASGLRFQAAAIKFTAKLPEFLPQAASVVEHGNAREDNGHMGYWRDYLMVLC